MSAKRKRQHTLPDRQLARAFRFSASDLAANRAGYITAAQKWGVPLWLRWLGDLRPFRAVNRHRQTSASVCGRAHLHYKQHQIMSIFHADIVEVHSVAIGGMRFRLHPDQHRAIAEGVVYRLYYDPDDHQILSLERAINGCDEAQS